MSYASNRPGAADDTHTHDVRGGTLCPESIETTYRQMFQKAEALLVEGHSVVLDASIHQRHRLQARQLAAHVGAEFCIMECWCPEEELRRRLEARVVRGDSVSDGRWEPPASSDGRSSHCARCHRHNISRSTRRKRSTLVVDAVLSQLAKL